MKSIGNSIYLKVLHHQRVADQPQIRSICHLHRNCLLCLLKLGQLLPQMLCKTKKSLAIDLSSCHGVWKSQKKSHSTLRAKRGYVYILSGQKLIKNAKNGPLWRVFENLKLAVKQRYQTGPVLIGQKLVENAKIQKFKCDILSNF